MLVVKRNVRQKEKEEKGQKNLTFNGEMVFLSAVTLTRNSIRILDSICLMSLSPLSPYSFSFLPFHYFISSVSPAEPWHLHCHFTHHWPIIWVTHFLRQCCSGKFISIRIHDWWFHHRYEGCWRKKRKRNIFTFILLAMIYWSLISPSSLKAARHMSSSEERKTSEILTQNDSSFHSFLSKRINHCPNPNWIVKFLPF